MVDVIIVADVGSSGSKFYVQIQMHSQGVQHQAKNPQLQLLLMEPHVIGVSRERLELYEKERKGHASPEDLAWVEYDGQCFAVGHLAFDEFGANVGEKELKYERAIPKILAAIGALAEREGLPSHFTLRLGVLLPYKQFKNREALEDALPQALSSFRFRFQDYSIELERFECKPEGGGLLLVRRKLLGEAFAQKDALVLVIGYFHASYLKVTRGVISGGTSDQGFIRLIEKVEDLTSGHKREDLIPAIYQAGASVDQSVLKSLGRSRDPKFRRLEVAQLVKATKAARKDCWGSLTSWFHNSFPLTIEEVGLTGGTAGYWQPELEGLFSYANIDWYEKLEQQAQAVPCNRVPRPALKYRTTDAYAFLLYLTNIPCRMARSA